MSETTSEDVARYYRKTRRGVTKFYVAGSFRDKERAREAMAEVRRQGGEVTCDWTIHDAETVADPKERKKYCAACAREDLAGVAAADVLLLLHDERCQGAFVELGFALARGKVVVVVGGEKSRCVFYDLPLVGHAPDEKFGVSLGIQQHVFDVKNGGV